LVVSRVAFLHTFLGNIEVVSCLTLGALSSIVASLAAWIALLAVSGIVVLAFRASGNALASVGVEDECEDA
jgi:hypothetical protein